MTANRPQTILDYLQATTEHFRKHGLDAPRLEAEMLLAHILKIPRIQLYVRFEQPLAQPEIDAYRELVKRRGRHEPVHYILGRREFWSLDFEVAQGVLIPRPDTEVLIEEALAFLKDRPSQAIAEVGVGSGAIAVTLLTERAGATVAASDISDAPLAIAKKNAVTHGVGDRLTLVKGSGLAVLAAQGPFDLVVSNPPYIREADMRTLPPHIRQWEPTEALVSGADGLDCIREILAALSPATLVTGGALLLEIGDEAQARHLQEVLEPAFDVVRIRKDYGDLARAIVALGYRGA